MSHKLKAATAVLAVSAMSIASAPMAQAHGNHGPWTKTLSTQVVAPFQLAVNHGVVGKAGAWFDYNDAKIGQGREATKKYLKENPDVLTEIDSKVREKVAAEDA